MSATHIEVQSSGEDSLVDQGMTIADRAMVAEIRKGCACLSSDFVDQAGSGIGIAFVPCSEDGQRVQKISQAALSLYEAFSWLAKRGHAWLQDAHDGQYIVLKAEVLS